MVDETKTDFIYPKPPTNVYTSQRIRQQLGHPKTSFINSSNPSGVEFIIDFLVRVQNRKMGKIISFYRFTFLYFYKGLVKLEIEISLFPSWGSSDIRRMERGA